MKKVLWLSAVLVIITFYNSCTKDKTQKPIVSSCIGVDTAANTYNLRIQGILQGNCAYFGCHDGAFKAGGFELDNYSDAKAAFQTKPVICAIKWGGGCIQMPQGFPKLADSLITYMQCWSESGYPQ